ncbi:YcnI family copper-binding membrane protein [Ramlibacter albus]|uniref:YcnI family protein n=1 Tax=Ramlibacter albus TaxID=2079448 RepID=A0A923M3L4_9BURK|nr:YcnI family protein [Ramlibacter albus]MBC5763542.1 YcnI family protein [Ramlibacter albus]
MKHALILLAGFALFAGAAHAHVGLEYEVANASSSYKATFKVGHGCDKSPTRQLSVQVPPTMGNARPMPKPGWTLEVQRQGEAASRITWTARTREDALPDNQYDEFVLVAQAPAQPGTVTWQVVQVCEQGRAEWAPKLEILPSAGGGHKH